ncbi:MAG: hypothetical protein DME59_13550 [Verrucomicrobia bacterium]|nr:MAG: hypothetical protein DME59_13550 [Verrucomicrobiota bacterium]PYL78077.1 MAG: hypothetical protein DMF26_01780 [Verrucomicrobiota bacterium]
MQLARWIHRALILVAVPRFSYLRTNTPSRRAITASLDNNFLLLPFPSALPLPAVGRTLPLAHIFRRSATTEN